MEKLFTDKDYTEKAIEANKLGEFLYIHTFIQDYNVEVLEWNYEEQEVETQKYDDMGNPLFDDEGSPITETITIKVKTTPIMTTETIIDEEGTEQTVEVQAHHTETRQKEVAKLLIAPQGYYVCSRENYTDGTLNANFEQEKAQKEALRISMLKLTAADVERAIYKAKGIDFDDIISLVEAQPLTEGEQPAIDVKALKIELKANNFYRGNPYIDAVGTLLGFTSEQLDEFFETNDYTKLLKE